MKIQIREFELQNLDHMEITVQHTTLFTTSCALISESLNRSLSVYNLDILSLQTARINNAQSLFPLTDERRAAMFNSEQPNNQRHVISYSQPTSELRDKLQPFFTFFFFTSKNDMSEHPVRFQCLWLGWLKALQPETSCRVDPTEKAKFRRDNRNLFFSLLFSVECTGITAAQRHALLSCGWLCCVDVWTCVSVTSHYKETPLWCVFCSNDLFMCWLNRPASHLLYDI